MAAGATVYHFEVELSDVDRATYARLDLRLARHPSESARYLLTRTLAYCLSYEEGIAFSKGGLSSSDDPPVAVWDGGGALKAWIDVGSPSARRLHKATRSAERVSVFTEVAWPAFVAQLAGSQIYRREQIDIFRLDPVFLGNVSARLDRKVTWALTRSDANVYVSFGTDTYETAVIHERLPAGA